MDNGAVPGSIMLFGYMLPSVIALFRNHPHLWVLLFINVFLGWTLVAWLILLVWAFIS